MSCGRARGTSPVGRLGDAPAGEPVARGAGAGSYFEALADAGRAEELVPGAERDEYPVQGVVERMGISSESSSGIDEGSVMVGE